jgi:Zn-dependent peptidase ImmA (M78 family)/transcriptional regulator with XRE-family HTH domain
MSQPPVRIDPIELGRRLQTIRKLSGRTQSDVAVVLGVSRPTVASIEAGQRRVDTPLLLSLVKAYDTRLSELVREAAPAVSLHAQFRLPAASPPAERTQLEQAVAALETLVARYLRLEEMLESPLRPGAVPHYRYESSRLDQDAEMVADAERRRLGTGDGSVLKLRDLLEREAGLRIFSIPMPSNIAALYGVSHEAGPCVAMNANHPAVRQRWSLAHEFGHFLTRLDRPEVTLVSGYQRVPEHERFADQFAAAFLMPSSGIERRIRELESADRQVTVADLLLIADEYEVSFQALVLRLEGLRVLPVGTWDALTHSGANMQAASEMLGVRPAPSDKLKFPRRFIFLALEAYDRELLTERELADLLGEDRLTVRELIETMSSTAQDLHEARVSDLSLSESMRVGTRP